MMKRPCYYALLLFFFCSIIMFPAILFAQNRKACIPFYLRNEQGEIINPISGQNAQDPYSIRQTCSPCHDYEKITKGYHFQQGRDSLKDNFSKKNPWALSFGMFGKH